jgi:hypothetical protein
MFAVLVNSDIDREPSRNLHSAKADIVPRQTSAAARRTSAPTAMIG